jgi:hypothetical protein
MMPSSFGGRAAGAHVFVLLLLGCDREMPVAPPPSDGDRVAVALAEAQSTQRELLLWMILDETPWSSSDRDRQERVAAAIGDGAALGVVTVLLRTSAFDLAPAPMAGLRLPSPGIGRSGDEPPYVGFHDALPMLVFADADGRPLVATDESRMATAADARRMAEMARVARRGRDGGFAAAAMLEGSERAAALKCGIEALDRWIVVRCYVAELEVAVELGDDSVRDWAAPLLREHRILQACVALRAASEDLSTVNPRRLARQLTAVMQAHVDLPEVAMLAACLQGAADLRLAVDDDDRRRILERVEAAVDAVERGPWRGLGRVWLLDARR